MNSSQVKLHLVVDFRANSSTEYTFLIYIYVLYIVLSHYQLITGTVKLLFDGARKDITLDMNMS